MPDRTKATAPPTASTAGLLRPDEFARHVDLAREPAGACADRWVENRWSLRWRLPEGRWYDSEVLPHPTCSLTVELGSHPRHGDAARARPSPSPGCAPAASTSTCAAGAGWSACASAPVGWPRSPATRHPPGPTARWRRPRCCPRALVATLADPDLAASGTAWAEVAEHGLAALADGRARPALRPAARRRRRHARRPHPAHRGRGRRPARRHRAHPPAAVHALRRRRAEVGARPLPAARRRRPTSTPAGRARSPTSRVRYGWYDQAHFTRDFTALVGVTPGQYRDRATTADAGHPASAPG